MNAPSLRASALAAAILLPWIGCHGGSSPEGPDLALPTPAVVAVRLVGSPGPVGFAGEIMVFRTDAPPLALTLEGTTTEPPGPILLGEDVRGAHIELTKTQQQGTLRVEVLVNGMTFRAAETSDPFGLVTIDVGVGGA